MSNILIVSYVSNLSSGVGNRVFNLSRQLGRLGHEVTVLSRQGQMVDEYSGVAKLASSDHSFPLIPPVPLSNVTLFQSQALPKAIRFLRENRRLFVDLQHIHFSPGLSLLRRQLKNNQRLAVTCHGTEAGLRLIERRSLMNSVLSPFLERTERTSFANADVLIASSHFLKREIQTFYHPLELRTQVITNGIDLEELRQVKALHSSVRREPFRVLYVGGLSARKGLGVLMLALRTLHGVKIELVLAGPNAAAFPGSEFGEMARKLDESIGIRPLGIVSRSELLREYVMADLFVFPSLYEGFGIALLEAMGNELPIIASRIPPVEEVLGQSGWLVEPGNPMALGKALTGLISDQSLRRRLAKSASDRAKKYDWREISAEYANLVRQVVE